MKIHNSPYQVQVLSSVICILLAKQKEMNGLMQIVIRCSLRNKGSIVESFCCNKLHHPNYNQCCCLHHQTMRLQPILDVHMGIGLNFLLLKIAGP